jgi:cobalt/nickel transport system permease protein
VHLPNHYLDPTTCLLTGAISAGAVSWSLCRLRHEPRQVFMLLPVVSSGIFAAQMLNFPVAAGTSAHPLGGALAGILLGPWAGMIAMALVVIVQAIAFGDGGTTALGANVLNMAVLAAPLGAWIARSVRGTRSGIILPESATLSSRSLVGAAIAGAATVLAAALACSAEMIASRTFSAVEVLPAMLAAHAPIALAEAAITAAIVAVPLVLHATCRDPQPVRSQSPSSAVRRGVLTLSAAAIIALALSPFASKLPDGLESVGTALAPAPGGGSPLLPPLFGDYVLPGITNPLLATALAGLVGAVTVATLAAALLLLPNGSPGQTAYRRAGGRRPERRGAGRRGDACQPADGRGGAGHPRAVQSSRGGRSTRTTCRPRDRRRDQGASASL